MRATRVGRGALAALSALVIALPLAASIAACGNQKGANRALSEGMVTPSRETARTPDEIDFSRPAWRRDWSPAGDPYR
jgi:hypothetical protein